MQKKKNGTHLSSGAEKVENITEEKAEREEKAEKSKTSAKGAEEKIAESKTSAKGAEEKREANKVSAKTKGKEKSSSRLSKAERKALKKAKKLARKARLSEKKAAAKEKKLARQAELRERRLEKKAEKVARRELLKKESKAERLARQAREKKARLAAKEKRLEEREKKLAARRERHIAEKEKKAKERAQKKEGKKEGRKSENGFGGWLAATITLGVTVLALTSVVTAGAVKMNEMAADSVGGFRETVYEMTAATRDMDCSLDKLRVASGREESRLLLTDVLVDTALLESGIERCPVDMATGTSISDFVNRTNMTARRLLEKLASGEKLSAEDRDALEKICVLNEKIYGELNALATETSEEEIRDFLCGKKGKFESSFRGMTEEEKEEKTRHGAFKSELDGLNEVTVSEAEETLKNTFSAYHVKSIEYTGETQSKRIATYNFLLKDENEGEIFAEVSKKGGKVVFFDHYAECSEKNFDLETCDKIAREFLKKLGYEDVDAVWTSDGGMTADINYVALQDGVRMYPDAIRVRVCESRGIVTGMDASAYLTRHKQRSFTPKISLEEAKAALSEGLTPGSHHLAVISLRGKETLAYEFGVEKNGREYLVYVDAATGEQLIGYCVREDRYGRYLR